VVDELLASGHRVRGATRSAAKGQAMIAARPEYQDKLDFVQIEDFGVAGDFTTALQDIDGIIHVASVCVPGFWRESHAYHSPSAVYI
jgi:uncharacterized protein YbjT (DUF2867 family)